MMLKRMKNTHFLYIISLLLILKNGMCEESSILPQLEPKSYKNEEIIIENKENQDETENLETNQSKEKIITDDGSTKSENTHPEQKSENLEILSDLKDITTQEVKDLIRSQAGVKLNKTHNGNNASSKVNPSGVLTVGISVGDSGGSMSKKLFLIFLKQKKTSFKFKNF